MKGMKNFLNTTWILVTIAVFEVLEADAIQKALSEGREINKTERILYDVTADIHVGELLAGSTILSNIWPNESSSFYMGNSLGNVAFIQWKTNISNLRKLSGKQKVTKQPFLESVIFSMALSSNDCFCPTQNFTEFVESTMRENKNQRNVKIGLEVNKKFIDCCKGLKYFKYSNRVNCIVFRVDLTRTTALLSYGLFTDAITEHLNDVKNFTHTFNLHSTLYIKLVSNSMENDTSELIVSHFDALGMQYLKAWTSGHNYTGKEMYIQRPSNSNFTFIENNKFLKEKLSPAIYMGNHSVFSGENCHHRSECWKLLEALSSQFDHTLFVNPSFSFFTGYQNIVEEISPQSDTAKKTSMAFKHYNHVDPDEVVAIINKLVANKTTANLHAVYIDNEYKSLTLDLSGVKSKNITVGCYIKTLQDEILAINPSFLVENAGKKCGKLLNFSTQILMYVPVDIKTKNQLVQALLNVENVKKNFERKYNSKIVVPMIRVTGLGSRHPTSLNFNDIKSLNVSYCNPKLKLLNEYYQAIITFARIHQWDKLVLRPATNSINDLLLWRNVETNDAIDRSSTNFPLLFRSNAEKSINGDHLSFTYPCINWTQKTEKTSINFFEREYSGATFTAKLRKSSPLKPRELQTMLHISLSRFPFIEISGVNEQELHDANSVVHQLRFNAAKPLRQVDSTPTIFFEFSLLEAIHLRHDIENLMTQNYSAVHLTGWENYTTNDLSRVVFDVENNSNTYSKFGITVQDCSHEMNMGLINIKLLPFINEVGYVVCNVKAVLPNNINKVAMQTYLNTLFYVKSYMETSLSTKGRPVQILFRINLKPVSVPCLDAPDSNRDNFLRFINDVSQHSAAYKIRYFIVSAFAEEDLAAKCPNTWWSIKSYSDLTINYVYVDRENEYIGRPTHTDIKPLSTGNNTGTNKPPTTSDNNNIYLFAVLPVAVVIFLAMLLLWYQRQYYENRFLTQREVNQFYKPSLMSSDEIPMDENATPDSAYIQFPTKYEISARDIEVKDEIGRGQFGEVKMGILKKRIKVAIKIPLPDCRKEEFMSALSELKILCYVGKHPNIVSFLGAHTKNIRKGKLMIVIEYCGKGALESYIRSLDSPNVCPDLNQLYEFAHQIAAGMEHLSEKRIIHGDLATRNILLTEDFTCKISDFGLSRRLYDMSVYVKRGNEALPWMWMALESLKDMQFTTKSDVWSYAVTLWEIFTLGHLPYPGRRLTQGFIMELESGTRMEKAPLASDQIHQKMLECWSMAQEDRPTFTELRQYFASLRNHTYQNTPAV